MGICSAEGCVNKSYKDCMLSFHSFPLEDPVRLKKWLQAINKESWTPKKEHRVCSEHFQPNDFRSNGKRKRLRKEAIPSLSLQKLEVEDQIMSRSSNDENIVRFSKTLGSAAQENSSSDLIRNIEPSTTDSEMKEMGNLLGDAKSKSNVKVVLCKLPTADSVTSGITDILPSIEMNPKQEIRRLRENNDELVEKVKNLEKLVAINEKLNERVKQLENLVQKLQTGTIGNKDNQIAGYPRTEISVYWIQKYVDSDHSYSSSPKTSKRKLSVGLDSFREEKNKINTWQKRLSRSTIRHQKVKKIFKDSTVQDQ